MLLKMQIPWDVMLSLRDYFLTFQRHYDPSGCLRLLAQWHSVTLQKTCNFLHEFPVSPAKSRILVSVYLMINIVITVVTETQGSWVLSPSTGDWHGRVCFVDKEFRLTSISNIVLSIICLWLLNNTIEWTVRRWVQELINIWVTEMLSQSQL